MIAQTGGAGDETAPARRRGGIQAIERAGQILSLLDDRTQVLTPGLVAERLGLNRTTAHRYLRSMRDAGIVDAEFRLGPLFGQLAVHATGHHRVAEAAPSLLRRLSDETELTAVLSVLGPSGAVVAAVEESTTGSIILTINVGTVLTARAAQTRVLLAHQSNSTAAHRIHAGLSQEAMKAEQHELERVRRDGVAWADLGLISLASAAAPVFGRSGVEAAMALLGTTATLDGPDRPARRIDLLRRAADDMSELLTR